MDSFGNINNMKKTVILSSNNNPDYLNYLPYVVKAWNMLGWDTLTFLTEFAPMPDIPFNPDNQNSFVTLHGLGSVPRKEMESQVVRLFCGRFIQDGLIMTGDVDMIPLANYWNPNPNEITVYGFDLTGRSQYPICYIAMSAEKWREAIPETSLQELLDKYPNSKSDDFYKWWGVDQEIITDRLKSKPITFIDRGTTNGLAKGRIDRADWERTVTMDGVKIDAHCLRPFNLKETERIMKLIQI